VKPKIRRRFTVDPLDGIWLEIVPLGRATGVLQVCLKDRSLVRLGFQSTKLLSTLPRNCVDCDLGKFG